MDNDLVLEFNRPQRNVSNEQEVQLYIMAPRYLPDAVVRPMKYKYGEAVIEELSRNVQRMNSDFISSGGFGQQRLCQPRYDTFDRLYANECLGLDSDNPIRYGRSTINQYYHFVLILKNANLHARSRITKSRNQITYSGWFLDEPISFGFGRHFNLAAEMIFTHVNFVRVKTNLNSQAMEEVPVSQMDCDILSPSTRLLDSNQLSDRDFLIGPEELVNAISVDPDTSDTYANSSVNQLSNYSKAHLSEVSYNSPRKQLSRIVAAATHAAVTTKGDVTFRRPEGSFIDVRDTQASLANLGTYLHNKDREGLLSGLGPRVDQRLTIRQLLTLYPNLEDHTVVLEVDNRDFDVIDEERNDALVVASSFLKVTIPAIFSELGFSEASFRYATCDPNQRFIPMCDRDYLLEPISVTPFLEEPFEQTRDRFQMAIQQTVREAFAIVEDQVGDIDVLVNYQADAQTLIQLQILDQTAINHGFALYHGDLGGLVSPMIGTTAEFDAGTTLFNSISDSIYDYKENQPYRPLTYERF